MCGRFYEESDVGFLDIHVSVSYLQITVQAGVRVLASIVVKIGARFVGATLPCAERAFAS